MAPPALPVTVGGGGERVLIATMTETNPTADAPQREWLDEEPDDVPAGDRAPVHAKTARELFLGAIVFLAVAMAAVAVAAIPALANRERFDDLVRPFVLVPAPFFVAGWLVVVAVGVVAGWLAWRASGGVLVTIAWSVTVASAVLWVAFFAGLGSIGGALFVASLLFSAALVSTILLWRAALVAGILMLPVMVWSAYVFFVNFGYASLNFT